jgi:hypothetical protein
VIPEEWSYFMIKKTLIRVICLMMSTIIMIGVSGCMSSNSKSAKFSVDEILQYMSEKYGEEFTYLEPIDSNQPTATSLSIFVESANYPNKKIYAKCIASDNGSEKRFSDNFISIVYEDATKELLTNITTSVYPDAKINYELSETSASTYSGDGRMTFEEFLSKTASSISYAFILPPEHDNTIYKEESKKLFELFKKNNVVCSVTIAYAEDDMQFEDFLTGQWRSESIDYKLRGRIRVGESFEVEFEEWR